MQGLRAQHLHLNTVLILLTTPLEQLNDKSEKLHMGHH